MKLLGKIQLSMYNSLSSRPTILPEAWMNSTTTQPIFETKLPAATLTKGEREYQAFLRLLPQLLQTHGGKYVAIHEGEIVDSDMDDVALIQRVHARIGYVPIHVGRVTEPLPVTRNPHYREFRPNGERG